MTDSSALRFLVRRRTTFTWLIPLGLIAATCKYGQWRPIEFAAGVALLVLGEVVRFWAAGYIQKDNVIATTGPYAMVRNPLYFGSLLLAFGYLAMSGMGIVAWLIVLGLFLLFHLAAITSEERFLKGKFGAPYESYLRAVPRLIPMPFGRGKAADDAPTGSFSMHQALRNREHITAFVTFVTALIFALIQLYRFDRFG